MRQVIFQLRFKDKNMKNKEKKLKNDQKRLELACLKCKVKFNIWVSNSDFDWEVEERVKHKLVQYCPSCKMVEA